MEREGERAQGDIGEEGKERERRGDNKANEHDATKNETELKRRRRGRAVGVSLRWTGQRWHQGR